MNFSEFRQQVVLISGVSSGIGYAQAIHFLENGAFVFGIDLQEKPEIPHQYQTHFSFLQGDLSNKEICEQAVIKCVAQFNRVDILLNTAGILDGYQSLLETSDDLWHTIMKTDVNSYFYLTKAALPHMLAQNKGTIINMASIAGLVAGGGGIAYTTAKHAIIGFTKQLALDYANKNIRVKAIAPGAIETPMNAADFAGDGKMAKWVADETPVKRWAQPDEVANLTLFLASQTSSYLQGAVIPIDGGWTLK